VRFVHGAACHGKAFSYSIDPSNNNVCEIRVGRSVYTMVDFIKNAPRPAYSPACMESFDSVLAAHSSQQPHARRNIVTQALSFAPQAWYNPWDDAKAAFDDVEHWAGDVFNWAKAHYCQLCKPIVDAAIDYGSEAGADFVCDSVTEGAAADFCGELAKDAVKEGCDLLDCAQHICSAIGRQSC